MVVARVAPFFNPFRRNASPNGVSDHDYGHENDGDGKANEVGDLGGFRTVCLVAH